MAVTLNDRLVELIELGRREKDEITCKTWKGVRAKVNKRNEYLDLVRDIQEYSCKYDL